ncbi:hypothetical protein Q4555_03780 [Octadecabacter sp. 1_MG-2023]|uniref:hypothetical protein n=1 Tax=unclassified Octadecabacter TaxID=196158 RepID=UPI001C09B56F|nr:MULTISPECIES: hypothetical protein [unclassified Octadecabacter]MBU2992776.1 hypothetical protein [Octadecabacter sp. B2R22]MDO6733773.1 hypothetical protein [Octadecabacter sp. 1_MG-2023]
MRHLVPAALIGLTAVPAAAFDRMSRSDCQDGVQRAVDLMPFENETKNAAILDAIRTIRTTPQGWCEFTVTDAMDNLNFRSIEWRMDESIRWTNGGIPPLALEVRVFDVRPDDIQGSDETPRPPVDLEVTLRQIPEAGMIVVERAVMENDAGDSLAVSGVFERVFLSSSSMMQVSMGSAAFKAGLMTLTLDGTHENPFGFGVSVEMRGDPQAQFDAAFETISSLPDGVIDDASRAELTAFASDLPKPVGTLEVSVDSVAGLGLMQVVMSMATMATDIMDENGSASGNQMEILFHGLTVSADWSPDAQNAD